MRGVSEDVVEMLKLAWIVVPEKTLSKYVAIEKTLLDLLLEYTCHRFGLRVISRELDRDSPSVQNNSVDDLEMEYSSSGNGVLSTEGYVHSMAFPVATLLHKNGVAAGPSTNPLSHFVDATGREDRSLRRRRRRRGGRRRRGRGGGRRRRRRGGGRRRRFPRECNPHSPVAIVGMGQISSNLVVRVACTRRRHKRDTVQHNPPLSPFPGG